MLRKNPDAFFFPRPRPSSLPIANCQCVRARFAAAGGGHGPSITIHHQSVGSDEQQADAGDDERRREAELEVAEEGERVAVLLGAARLLAHDQVGGGAQQGEVAGHRARPGQDEPGVGLRGGGDGRRRRRHAGAQQQDCRQIAQQEDRRSNFSC